MYYILQPPLIPNFFYFLFFLWVFQIWYGHEAIVVFVVAVIFEELHGKNIVESGVLIRKGNMVGLATDTLEYSKGTNLAG